MPRSIHAINTSSAINGVLLRRKVIRNHLYLTRLESLAQAGAKRILRDAQHKADLLHLHAYKSGYEQGMLCLIQQVATYLTDSKNMAWHWRERLIEQVKTMLSASVEHPDTILLLLDEWLHQTSDLESEIYITLPKLARELQPKIMAALANNWEGGIHIEYHEEPSFIIRHADQLVEFLPEQYVQSSVRLLQNVLDKLAPDCHRISDNALLGVIERLQEVRNGYE